MRARGFEQTIGSDNIGGDKIGRSVDRTVDMRFGGEIYNRGGTVLAQQFCRKLDIANVTLDENMVRIFANARKAVAIPGISELIQIDDGPEPEGKPVEDEIGADETSTTRDEHGPLTGHSLRSAGDAIVLTSDSLDDRRYE